MKRLFDYSRWAMMILVLMLTIGCSSDSDLFDDDDNTENSGSGNSGSESSGSTVTYNSSLSDLTGFDIAIDKTALGETETIPTEGDDHQRRQHLCHGNQ